MNDDKGWLLNDYKNITKWGVDSFRTTYAYFSDEDLTKEGSSTKIYEINLNSFYFFYQNKKNSLLFLIFAYYHQQNEKEIQKNK